MTDLHSHSFDFEADFTSDLRCIPMAVRRKLDLAGVKLKLSHWGALAGPERQRLLQWPDHSQAIEQLRQWLLERTAAMADGQAKLLPAAVTDDWQQAEQLPALLEASCRQLQLPLPNTAWQELNELQRFALVKLSHPGHEHRNLPAALREFGLIDIE